MIDKVRLVFDGLRTSNYMRYTTALLRGPEPRGHVKQLIEYRGVTDIICLQRGWYDLFNELLRGKRPVRDELRMECIREGVKFHEIPCSDFRAPTWAQTKEFLAIVDHALDNERVVYVHCLHGKDRTGWMCASFRVLRQSWTKNEAVAEWHRLGHHKRWYFWWTKAWRNMGVFHGD